MRRGDWETDPKLHVLGQDNAVRGDGEVDRMWLGPRRYERHHHGTVEHRVLGHHTDHLVAAEPAHLFTELIADLPPTSPPCRLTIVFAGCK